MAAEGSKAKGGKDGKEEDVGEMLKNMKLHEAELDDVVLGKETIGGWPQVKWLATAKVLTSKPFGLQTLKSTMEAAWTPAQKVEIHGVEPNLFVVQASCLGDWKRIMDDGPWLFRGCALMVEPFDRATMVPVTVPSKVLAWIQIHKLPPLFRNKDVLIQLATRVGEVVAVEMAAVQTRFGEFHRVRVKLDSTRTLVRVVPLAPEGHNRMLLQVKYENMPRYCERCGLMGHLYLECGEGEYVIRGSLWTPPPQDRQALLVVQ
jgi:hypothetical protein